MMYTSEQKYEDCLRLGPNIQVLDNETQAEVKSELCTASIRHDNYNPPSVVAGRAAPCLRTVFAIGMICNLGAKISIILGSQRSYPASSICR
jgi:hypothetical protein